MACLQVRKRHFSSHLYIKCIILPRQARDEHRESTQKKCRFPSLQATLSRVWCLEELRVAMLMGKKVRIAMPKEAMKSFR